MKFVAALLSIALASTSAANNAIGRNRKLSKNIKAGHKLPDSIKVNSKLGGKVMSQARQLDEDEVDFSWVENYSIKFQGCHHISQWNQDADDEEDVRIATKRLVRFRLCPSDECSLQNAGGCSSGYGEYVIDMNIFLESYIESIEQYNEAKCEYLENMSGCGNNDDGDNADYCVYDYYVSQGMEDICAEENPYKADDDAEEAEQFEIADYVECAEAKFENDNRRKLEEEEEEVQYFLGPYCAEQGGAIFLGMFTDDTCSTFADEYGGKQSYYELASEELPFGSSNIVSMDCYKCQEPEVQFNYDGDDNQDDDGVSEMCEAIYTQAGKCEANIAYGDNYNACTYIQGIQVIRKNGIIVSAGSKANKTASIFIGFFVVAFVLLSAFVYFLKTKLDRASINLAE